MEHPSGGTGRHPALARVASVSAGFFLTAAAMFGLLSLVGIQETRFKLSVAVVLGVALVVMEPLWQKRYFRRS